MGRRIFWANENLGPIRYIEVNHNRPRVTSSYMLTFAVVPDFVLPANNDFRGILGFDQLNRIIDATFSDVEKFEPFHWYTALQSLYTALDHQLQDGLMDQHEFERTRYIVRKLWDLKLQIHMIEKEDAQPSDAIGHIITLMLDLYSEVILTRSLYTR